MNYLFQLNILGCDMYVVMWDDQVSGNWIARGYWSEQYAREFLLRKFRQVNVQLEVIRGKWDELAWILHPTSSQTMPGPNYIRAGQHN